MAVSKSKLTPFLIVVVGFLTVCPVVMLVLGSFSEGLGAFGRFTLQKYIQSYGDPELIGILVNTVVFTVGSGVVATFLALFLAYLNTRTNIPFKFLFRIISIIPMMIPHILFSVSWVLLLNPSNGLINLVLKELLHMDGSLFNIYTLPGMILVEGLLDLPIAYLILAPALAAFDISLEESSKVCGASNLKTLFRVTLPVLRPAILASFILVIVRSLASFAVPSVIGMPGRIYVLATHIYRIIATGFAADYGMAAAIGMSAMATSIALIYVYRHLTSESEKYVTISSRGYRPTLIDLKGAKTPLFVVVGIISFVLILLPVIVLFYTSLVPYSMIPSAKAFSLMSWKNWLAVIHDPISLLSVKNSVFLGIVGATLGIVLSIFVSYVIVKVRSTSSGILESLSFLSFSFPGIVVGIGFMWFFRADALVRHHLVPVDRLYRHLPALRHPAAHQRLCPDPQPPRGILQGLRGRDALYLAAGGDSAADSRHRLGLDPDGHHVRTGVDPLGGALPAGDRGAGRADFQVCGGRSVGQAFGPGDHDDFYFNGAGGGGFPDRRQADSGADRGGIACSVRRA